MNAMTRTIKVRRANNNTAAIGTHLTLTNVKNDPNSMFAFAMTDAGDEVYIPANIVRAQQMTEADIGAGLTCPLRPNPRANSEANNPPYVAIHPVKWDGEAEEIEVDDDEDREPDISSEDWDDLVATLADLTEMDGQMTDFNADLKSVRDGLSKQMAVIDGLLHKGYEFQSRIHNARAKLDDLAPEVNE